MSKSAKDVSDLLLHGCLCAQNFTVTSEPSYNMQKGCVRNKGDAGTGDCSGATYRAWLYGDPVPSLYFYILELPNLKLPFPEGWCHLGEVEQS